ncbi:MAG TPA: hypothetical protein VF638_12985 [Sphingomonas sp.]
MHREIDRSLFVGDLSRRVSDVGFSNTKGRPLKAPKGERVLPLLGMRNGQAIFIPATLNDGWMVDQVRRFIRARRRLLLAWWVEDDGQGERGFVIERGSDAEEEAWNDRGRPMPI